MSPQCSSSYINYANYLLLPCRSLFSVTVNKRITLLNSQTCSVGASCATRPSVPTQVVPSTVTLASIERYNPGDVFLENVILAMLDHKVLVLKF